MITAEQFLRRSLLAPIIVPLMIGVHILLNNFQHGQYLFNNIDNLWFAIEYSIAGISGLALLFGFIPYVWMLSDKDREIKEQNGLQLEYTIKMLPCTMVPYFLKAMIIPCVIGVFIPNSFWIGPTIAFIGMLATIIVGYIYIGISFAFLRLYQSLGMVD